MLKIKCGIFGVFRHVASLDTVSVEAAFEEPMKFEKK